jgi:hypothetical protein
MLTTDRYYGYFHGLNAINLKELISTILKRQRAKKEDLEDKGKGT